MQSISKKGGRKSYIHIVILNCHHHICKMVVFFTTMKIVRLNYIVQDVKKRGKTILIGSDKILRCSIYVCFSNLFSFRVNVFNGEGGGILILNMYLGCLG